jgi:hypothetical protein
MSNIKLVECKDDTLVLSLQDKASEHPKRLRVRNGDVLASVAEVTFIEPELLVSFTESFGKSQLGKRLDLVSFSLQANPIISNISVLFETDTQGGCITTSVPNGDMKGSSLNIIGDCTLALMVNFLEHCKFEPKNTFVVDASIKDEDLPIYDSRLEGLLNNFIYGIKKRSNEILAEEMKLTGDGAGDW